VGSEWGFADYLPPPKRLAKGGVNRPACFFDCLLTFTIYNNNNNKNLDDDNYKNKKNSSSFYCCSNVHLDLVAVSTLVGTAI
jgi:hypothetical protein